MSSPEWLAAPLETKDCKWSYRAWNATEGVEGLLFS